MKTPLKEIGKKTLKIFQNKILNPIVEKGKPHELKGFIESFVNIYYKMTQDAAFTLIFLDAISLYTSKKAQIDVLKKKNEQNKEYLIEQQQSEFTASLILTVLLPALVMIPLGRLLSSGKIMTASSRDIIEKVVKPYLGYTPNDGYYIQPFKNVVKEGFQKTVNFFLTTLKKIVPKQYKNQIKIPNVNPNNDIPVLTLKNLLFEFDQKVANELKKINSQDIRDLKYFKESSTVQEIFRKKPLLKNSAVAHINGEIEGIKILSLIGLNIVTSNIVMPIFKNMLTNHKHKKELALIGETLNSKRRKDHYSNLKGISFERKEKNIFEAFSNYDNSITKQPLDNKSNNTKYQNLIKPKEQENIFKDINTFSTTSTQSSRLRI